MTQRAANDFTQRYRDARKIALVAAGIVIGQAVLYGPALVGTKVLLPLGCLAGAGYLPHVPGTPEVDSPQPVLLDLVTITEPNRRFAAREISAGRFPYWTPHEFGGVPFTWPKYSPYFLLAALSESPIFIAWAQLFGALVAGFGAFAFCRRVLRLSYWPSALAAWCYPITGWFVLWQGFAASVPVMWLPWNFYCIDRAIRGARLAAVALAFVTFLTVVSGNLDVAGQVLLVAGLFALWWTWHVHRGQYFRFLASKGGLALVAGWGFGFLLATPSILPFQEYARTSDRLSRRATGAVVERPPVGIIALPQIVLPDMYGTYAEKGTCPLLEAIEANQLESPAECYTGLLATLLLAPWALLDRRRRSATVGFLLLGGFGLGWVLDVPGMVHILRLPGLNLMSHNRLVFATSFCILALAAIGLECLLEGELARRPRLGAQLAVLSLLLAWCLYRSSVFPEPLASEFEARIRNGNPDIWVSTVEAVRLAKSWFAQRYARAAVLCAAGVAIWMVLHFRPSASRWWLPVIGGLLVGDLLLFGHGKRILEDRKLYFPEVPALAAVAAAPPGRVLGINCLPANLAQAIGLMDVRGFDSIDPSRWLRLLSTASADGGGRHNEYAAVQSFSTPYTISPPDSIKFSPVLDMLSVRYAIFRGTPGPGITPRFQSPDYWVLENRSALPRVSVPGSVKMMPDDDETLRRLARPDFDARKVAYIVEPVALPASIHGSAEIKEEIPTRILVEANMETPGLLVLADNWDEGWHAYVNGKPAPILVANGSLRGVVLAPGPSKVEFRYESEMVRLGNVLALLSLAVLLGWTAAVWRRRRKPNPPGIAETSA